MFTQHDYLTPAELADLVRLPLGTIYAWRHKGTGPPALKVGRHIRYRRCDVDAWLDECGPTSRAGS